MPNIEPAHEFMNTNQQVDAKQILTDQVRRARLRLTNAENQLATAREEARLARRRRKEAKQAARAAKKAARLAKERVARAQTALARLEARLAQCPRSPVEAKPRKTPAIKVAAAPLRQGPVRTAPVRRRRILKVKRLVARRTRARPALSPIAGAAKIPGPISPELETPVEVLPPAEQKPTPQIVKRIEEIFIEAPVAPESPAPAVETIALPAPPAKPLTINPRETL